MVKNKIKIDFLIKLIKKSVLVKWIGINGVYWLFFVNGILYVILIKLWIVKIFGSYISVWLDEWWNKYFVYWRVFCVFLLLNKLVKDNKMFFSVL